MKILTRFVTATAIAGCAALTIAVGVTSAGATTTASTTTTSTTTTSNAASATAAASTSTPVKPVASVQLSRYVGRWYQIAAIPQIFELQCARDVTAVYTANSDGTVGVNNTCATWWGSSSQVLGTARVENAPANSVLTVSFVNLFGQQLYFGGPNYEIIGLDANYGWAVVVSPDRSSAFVLSRTPALNAAATKAVKATITGNGIDACTLMTTPQTGGIATSVKFC